MANFVSRNAMLGAMNTSTEHFDSLPPDERTDAMAEVMQQYRPADSEVREMVEMMQADLLEAEMTKATNLVMMPNTTRERGMKSVELDKMVVNVNGAYIDRPGLDFAAMRSLVDQTPVLGSVVMTRIRQVQRFCRPQESGFGYGFTIRHRDRDHQLTATERESIQLLQRFWENCGWEFDPRQRRLLRRDSFTQFMTKLTRDSLTMDACAIETEFKRDKRLGIDGLYAIDGSTIHLCTDDGYDGDDQIIALQVVQGRICTKYSIDDLIYEPRNPRSDIIAAGYGMGEVEMLVKLITGYLNALTYNNSYFDANTIPKGVLHMTGNYSQRDLAAFKRYWNSLVKGVKNAWTVPVMTSKDQESRVAFEKFGAEQNEMMFARWMTFLTSAICAVFGMDPAEINSDSFSAGASPLSGSDTGERLAASKDKGLRPLLSYFENLFTDYVVSGFGDKYCFRWTGLDEEDEDKRWERGKLSMTWNEMRAEDGREAVEGPIGDVPINPSLVGPWMQLTQQQQDGEGEDFGNPDGQQQPPQQGEQDDKGEDGEQDQQQQEQDAQQGKAPPQQAKAGKPPAADDADTMSKAFGLPPLRIGDWS